jgi:hypothetical protein
MAVHSGVTSSIVFLPDRTSSRRFWNFSRRYDAGCCQYSLFQMDTTSSALAFSAALAFAVSAGSPSGVACCVVSG